jgi:iron complex transport system substrate-binding protein
MSNKNVLMVAALVAVLGVVSAQTPTRIVMGGRAVVMVADAVYAFPGARSGVIAVGGADQGLGTFLRVVDPGYKDAPTLPRQAGAEVYASLQPDLVILKTPMKAQLGPGFDALGIKALYLNLESPEDYYKELAILGSLFGEEARAAELVSYYRDAVERAGKAAGGSSAKPRLLVLQAAGGGYEVPPSTWMQTKVTELAGAVPVWTGANPGGGWAKVGAEQILAWNPDAVCVISYNEDPSALARGFASDARFASLKAVRTGQVYAMPQDFLSWDQPDARWGLGLLWLSSKLHPGGIPGYNTEAEARRFFQLFYGLDGAAFQRDLRPKLRGDWQ